MAPTLSMSPFAVFALFAEYEPGPHSAHLSQDSANSANIARTLPSRYSWRDCLQAPGNSEANRGRGNVQALDMIDQPKSRVFDMLIRIVLIEDRKPPPIAP
jgi:hypothetical protein